MRKDLELVTLFSVFTLVSCLELKCAHLESNAVYRESERFCKNRDLAKHEEAISENSSMNLLCSLTLSLLNEDTCKQIDLNSSDLKSIEPKPLCNRFTNVLSSTAITSDYSKFLLLLNNTNLCTKICIDFYGKVQAVCKLLLNVLLIITNTPKSVNVIIKGLNATNSRNGGGDPGFDFGDKKVEPKHATIKFDVRDKLKSELSKVEEQSDLIIVFGLAGILALGYLIYFNKQKIMGCIVEGPNARSNNNRKYNYRKLKVNLEDTISSNDNSYDKESSYAAVIY